MTLARTFTTAAALLALSLAAAPADADQRRRDNGEQRDRGGEQGSRRAVPRSNDGPRAERRGPPSQPAARAIAPRATPRAQGRAAVPRSSRAVRQASVIVQPRVVVQGGRGRSYGPAYGSRYRAVHPRVYAGYRGPRVRYARPYYSFRPRIGIGFGIFVGFPVSYPAYGYGYPYAYPVPYPYPAPYPVPYGSSGYPAQAPGTVTAAPGAYGGLSFEITPSDAEVYVDGGYAGEVNDFGPYGQPLTLAPGLHRIEIQAPGYLPLAFDVTITAGHVIPYQGVLQPGP